jgi:cytosine/uracil/thiamine/allantoin permease
MPLFSDMMGYMSVLLGLLFSVLLRETIHAASSSHPHFSPWWELGVFLAGTAATLIYYLVRIFAVANETRTESPGAM